VRVLLQLPVAVALLVLCAPCDADHTDWPGWGGPDRNFVVDGAGVFDAGRPIGLRVVWRKPLGTAYSGVAVANGLVVTMYSDGTSDHVVALDAGDGSERWRYLIGPTYLGHYGSQSGPVSTPLLTGGRAIALSPQGSLFALDAASGNRLWAVDLVKDHHGIVPYWGFTTSPLAHGGLLIVQTGGGRGNAISAFRPEDGSLVWSACRDTVNYQSPALFRFGDTDHLVFHGNRTLVGLDPGTGNVLWEFAHGGQSSASSTSGHPVEIAQGRYFIKNRGNGGVLVSLARQGAEYAVDEVWRTRHIRGTYIYPVHHSGYLYGYNGRILTCVHAETGERAWRSREPGDGLPAVIDGHLVIVTKEGRLAVAQASGEGYHERTRTQLFDDIVWSPVSFADGRIYARSMSEIACVEVTSEAVAEAPAGPVPGIVPGSQFSEFVDGVLAATDKSGAIDRFVAEQETFPVIEGDSLVHFVYRGEADGVTMTGDLGGRRYDQPMHRVSGTDLFYFSSPIEPDARITYRYTVDLQKTMPDPRNPRQVRTRVYGRASWFGMPRWEPPAHLDERQDGVRGRIDTLRFTSSTTGRTRAFDVYLPPGYDRDSGARYPVVYIHDARRARTMGSYDAALNNLIGTSVRPLIAVYLSSLVGGSGYAEYVGERRDEYTRTFAEEVVPLVDRTYRTIADRSGRANLGMIYGGFAAFYATFTRPGVFGGLAIQTMDWDQTAQAEHADLVEPSPDLAHPRIYLDWGRYDLRSPMDGNDLGRSSRLFAELLRSRGYAFEGGMVNDGAGWASWKNRTHRVFETLFPLPD